jgi:tRNA (guanine10-N2)-dimethyltransferase
MKILFELSKEHETLPVDEILCCFNAENVLYKVLEKNENVIVIDTDASVSQIMQIAKRLAYCFYVEQLLFSCKNTLMQLQESIKKNPIVQDGSLAIYCKNKSSKKNSKQILSILAKSYAKDRVVDLESAEIKIRAIITDNAIFVGKVLYQVDRSAFEQRKVQFRPFFSPISLHPKLARSLVNLCQVSQDGTVLDPFCGTGGILLEAGLLGINVIGSDIEEKMIQGSKTTLDFYNIKNYGLFQSDIADILSKIHKPVDAVVTDFPYARSTTTKGEDIKSLYRRSFLAISSVLKKNGFAVVGVFDKKLVCLDEKTLRIVKIYEFRVHRSMIRYFFVIKKI